ncbi:MAG: hypothetical protein E6K56_02365 [Ignavibacteria bacterium]|nr:MAG: hypothetical protein E6K56_02365 [Ignavibacteria bacterium]
MKRFAIVACLLVAGVASLFGQAKPGGIARELAMGGSNAGTMIILNPFIMEDPSLMLVNPAYQSAYSDYAWANVGGGGLTGLSSTGAPIGDDGYGKQFAGVAFGLTNEWSIGATLSYDPSAVNLVNSSLIPAIVQGPRGAQGIPRVANVWEVVLSNRMGSMDWGVGVMYGNSNTDNASTSAAANTSSEASSSLWGFRAGLVAPFGSGNTLDVSGALRLDKATTGKYSASGTEFQVSARAKFNVSSKFNFVPYGQFLTVSAEPKEDERPNGVTSSPATFKASITTYAVGAGGEYHTQAFYFAGGISWQTLRVKNETSPPTPAGGTNPGTTTNTTTYSAIPVLNLGGEWWFLDWLAGRSGYYRSLGKLNFKNEPPTGGTTTESNTSFPNSLVFIGGLSGANFDGLVTMGLGFKLGGACIDATVSEEALRRGLGLIGASDNINTFGYITASYAFGE